MSYGKVSEEFWIDDKMSVASDSAKLLALYFLSGPHRNAIGCFRIPLQYIVADLRWDATKVADALSELTEMGFITRDENTGWTLVNNLLKHDPIRGDKAAIGAFRLASVVPKGLAVYEALYIRLFPIISNELNGDQWAMQAPSKGDSKPLRSPEPTPEPTPEPLPNPNPVSRAPRAGNWQAEFSEFWAVYPVHKGKRAAFLAFGRALKRAEHSEIIAGAQRYANDPARKPDFTAHPATWLNQDRWLDEAAETGVERALKAITNGSAHDDYR